MTLDGSVLEETLKDFTKESKFPKPVNASFTYTKDTLSINPGKEGATISLDSLKNTILSQLKHTLKDVTISIEPLPLEPHITTKDAESLQESAATKLNQRHTLQARQNTITLKPEQIFPLLQITKKTKPTIELNEVKVRSLFERLARSGSQQPVNQITTIYTSGKQPRVTMQGKVGYAAENVSEQVDVFAKSFEQNTPYHGDFRYRQIPFAKGTKTIDDIIRQRIITYSVITWGTVHADFNEFKNIVAATFKDKRGWSAAHITFKYVTSGEDLTVVLSEPKRVANASPICDAYYSCRVGRFAIINDDRWRLATPVWTDSLQNYQRMVLNHETGHWLGRGHAFCGGKKQTAPVMQQQSMGLQGCKPNAWPLPWEIESVRR